MAFFYINNVFILFFKIYIKENIQILKGSFALKKVRTKINRINQFLEMPEELISNKPKITMLGFDQILIENYKNILEYDEVFIKINTYIGVIDINGLNLKLMQMNKEDLMINR